jgi:lipopolysaccharide biosynthesis regulator YciM
MRFGAVFDNKVCQSHLRLEHDEGRFGLTNRALAVHKDLVIGSALTAGVRNHQVYPLRYDFLLGLKKQDYDLYLRHTSTNKDKLSVGNLFADVVVRAK